VDDGEVLSSRGTRRALEVGAVTDSWLTKGEIARHLRVSTKTVERYMKRGMPYSKPFRNGSVTLNAADVDAWRQAGSRSTPAVEDERPRLLIGDRQALMRVRNVLELEADKLGPRSAARGWLHARCDEITGALERERFRGV
jgi:hypothetical protein